MKGFARCRNWIVSCFSCEPRPEAVRTCWRECFFWILSKPILLSAGEKPLETLHFEFPAGRQPLSRKAQVGVVASGNLEVLMEPRTSESSTVRVRTSVTGFQEQWLSIFR